MLKKQVNHQRPKQSSHPFILQPEHRQMLTLVNEWLQTKQQTQSPRVLSQPMHPKSTLILLYYLLNMVCTSKKNINMIYLADTVGRAEFLCESARMLRQKYFTGESYGNGINSNMNGSVRVPEIDYTYESNRDSSQIVFMSIKQFVRLDLPRENVYSYMLLEASNVARAIKDAFADYVTDTHLRRGYIQALRLEEAYKESDKIGSNKVFFGGSFNLNKKKQQQLPQIISIVSKDSQPQPQQPPSIPSKQQQQQNPPTPFLAPISAPSLVSAPVSLPPLSLNPIPSVNLNPKRPIRKSYDQKRQQLLQNARSKLQNPQKIFQSNQLIIISQLIFIIGFLSNQLQVKKPRNFAQFLQQFQNKTRLSKQFLVNMLGYYEKVYMGSPVGDTMGDIKETYLYAICLFMRKVLLYKDIFQEDYKDLFQIKFEKFPIERREIIAEEVTNGLSISCNQNNKICHKIFVRKTLKSLIIQNFACPPEYWFHIFKRPKILLTPQPSSEPQPYPFPYPQPQLFPELSVQPPQSKFTCLYGLHISKTPSNQDLDFSQKMKADIETIKIKSCGVLLSQLAKFTPDGIVVYFHSLEGLENFFKEMDKDQEKILKRIDSYKKIFVESVFEEINMANFDKFRKCCDIGRGAIFLMAANTKASQYLRFYNHLSRCIVFFGLPRTQKQPHKISPQLTQEQVQQNTITNIEKHAIFNQYINNCINNFTQYKSIIFVGRQITNDLQNWYKSFIRTWDQTTRESLPKLRQHYQKMGAKTSLVPKK